MEIGLPAQTVLPSLPANCWFARHAWLGRAPLRRRRGRSAQKPPPHL